MHTKVCQKPVKRRSRQSHYAVKSFIQTFNSLLSYLTSINDDHNVLKMISVVDKILYAVAEHERPAVRRDRGQEEHTL